MFAVSAYLSSFYLQIITVYINNGVFSFSVTVFY